MTTYELHDDGRKLDAFAFGRFSDNCERGRANNVALAARSSLAEGQLGLVRAAYLTAFPDARLIKLDLPTFGAAELPPVGTRGKVNGLSDESRRRLMVLLHTIRRDAKNPAFVTLTLPDDRLLDARGIKVALDALFKRWARRDARLCAVWRVEAHPKRSIAAGRPVPHVHLLVWGAWIDREQLSLDWAEIVDAPDFERHLASGTKVESIRSFRGVCSYAAKYISKVSDVSLGDDAGRVWGIFNKRALPIGRSVVVKIDAAQCVEVVRRVKQMLADRKVATDWLPRSIYIENPIAFLEGIVSDDRWRGAARI